MVFLAPLRYALRARTAHFVVKPLSTPLRRTFSYTPQNLQGAKLPEQPRLRIGTEAPNFTAETTHGKIDFHKFIGDSWAILFSHPADFTPVCTTELGAFAKLAPEFAKRNVKLIGLSANGLESHGKWAEDIDEVTGSEMASANAIGSFPIIADESREISFLYDMVDEAQVQNWKTSGIAFTIRSVFIVDPSKKIRLMMAYPASTGRNTAEVLRVVDSLQTADKQGIATPINWNVGDDVIVPPTVSTADAKKKFGEDNVRELKPYLRFTSLKN
ncbi:thioredoxin-like protein [Geopyxis carbonaria]|nr:thioredoxin-like protein [Geopyxis carbonaria]